ncbi:MAG: hypothetical protein M1838_003456 [Thelocarpon superellum]|nr:MAG: hypothetical protein M1838_003456 [Thelocarpon superellum]
MAQSPKIALYSTPDLKNTTDDALPAYLTSVSFKQSHFYTDVRLALGYTAVVIAGVTFYLDYRQGWDATKHLTFYTTIVYFALNTALTYWIWAVEAGRIFVGGGNGAELEITTRSDKHSPLYHLHARYRSGSSQKWETRELEAPFTRWFDEDGHFVALPFQRWLASEVPVIGRADPNNAKGGARKPEAVLSAVDHLAADNATATTSGASVKSGSGSGGEAKTPRSKRR